MQILVELPHLHLFEIQMLQHYGVEKLLSQIKQQHFDFFLTKQVVSYTAEIAEQDLQQQQLIAEKRQLHGH